MVWGRDKYDEEVRRQLGQTDFYQELTSSTPPSSEDHKMVVKTINKFVKDKELPPSAALLKNNSYRQSVFYILPKIHKINCPGRPIVSAVNCPTERISSYLDYILQPFVVSLPSYVKDTTHALNIFNSFNTRSTSSSQTRFIFTMDVNSLYTSIPHKEGLLAIKFFLDQRQILDPPTNTLVRLAELVLQLNTFEFNQSFYRQKCGVAMGTRMGPSFACLFMGYLEKRFFDSYTGTTPLLYMRYIDDIVGIFDGPLIDVQKFMLSFNNFHNDISFTYTCDLNEAIFLDLKLTLINNQITSSIYYKPTDAHLYLDYTSNHPLFMKNSIPFSQFLRLRRICSVESDFHKQIQIMSKFFLSQGYPDFIIDRASEKVTKIDRTVSLQTRPKQDPHDRPICIIPYHPNTRKARNIIMNNWNTLKYDSSVGDFFACSPLFAYKRLPNLRELLVRTKARPDTPPGTRPCSMERCLVCKHIDPDSLVSGPKGRFEVKRSFSCCSTNIVYVIRCNKCNLIYVGETKRSLSDRMKEHLRDIRNSEQKPVARHFNSPGHDSCCFKCQAIWQCHSDSVELCSVETHFIELFGSVQPYGMNVRIT